MIGIDSRQIEGYALGNVLLSDSSFAELAGLTADHFSDPRHRHIFAAMARSIELGVKPTMDHVTDDLKAHGHLVEAGGEVYLSSIIDGCALSGQGDFVVKIRERHAAKLLRARFEGYIKELDMGASVHDVAIGASRAAQEAMPSKGTVCTMADLMDKIEKYQTGEVDPYLMTGLEALDSYGIGRQELIVIGARPSIGKTAFGMTIADRLAKRGERVLFISLETTSEKMMLRRLALISSVNSKKMMHKGALNDGDWGAMSRGAGLMHDHDIPIISGRFDMPSIAAAIRRAVIEQGTGVVFIDYLGKVLLPGKTSEVRELGDVTGALVELVNELGITIFLLSQLNRGPEGRDDRTPRLGDLRGSGAIEQDCDQAWLLFRKAYYFPDDDDDSFVVDIAKNRNGERGSVKMKYMAQTCCVYE